MDEDSTERPALLAGEGWFDPIEAGLRERIRGFIEELLEQELTEALGRRRHGRGPSPGHRHGHRERRLTGSFGPVTIAVPRARPGCAPRMAPPASGAAPRCRATRGGPGKSRP